MSTTKNKTWSEQHEERYNAIYNYLKNTQQLNIEKDNYVETMTPRILLKHIMDNKNGLIQQNKIIFLLLQGIKFLKSVVKIADNNGLQYMLLIFTFVLRYSI